LGSTFTTKDALSSGVHPRALYGWRDSGRVFELSRGVFRWSDAPLATFPDLLGVSVRAPHAIACVVTAAVVHDLSDEMPPAVQIAVRVGDHQPRVEFPRTQVLRFARETFELGLSRVEAAPGEWVRVYDATRTVVDLMRLRHRFREPLAHSALRRALESGAARPVDLLRYAEALNVLGPVRLALDIALAR